MARRLALLALLFVLQMPMHLFAQSGPTYRVGLVALGPKLETLLSLAASSADTFGKEIHLGDDQLAALSSKQQQAMEAVINQQRFSAYETQDAKKLASLDLSFSSDAPSIDPIMSAVYTVEVYDTHVHELSGSDEGLRWFMQKRNYDELILFSSQNMGNLERIRISSFVQKRTILLDRLIQAFDYQSLAPALQELFLTHAAKKRLGALVIEHTLPSLVVAVDGRQHDETTLLLSPGEHVLDFTAAGFIDKTLSFQIEEGKIQTLAVELSRQSLPDLTLYSLQGIGTWYVDGRESGTSLSISLSNPAYPLVVSISKSGFENTILQVDQPIAQAFLSMKPTGIASRDLLKQQQKDFYNRLRNTILLFGAYVGCSALSKTFASSNPFWQVALVGTSSLSIVSSVALVTELASYAALAGQGY